MGVGGLKQKPPVTKGGAATKRGGRDLQND